MQMTSSKELLDYNYGADKLNGKPMTIVSGFSFFLSSFFFFGN